jgi:hypothetical protein
MPHMRDVRIPLQKCPAKSLHGFSAGTAVLVMGQVTLDIQDVYGVKRQITTIDYYVLKANIRLFSQKVDFD